LLVIVGEHKMKITQRMLRRIIAEEISKSKTTRKRRRRIAEGSRNRPVRVTPTYINRLIREEYEAFQNQKRIVEARRRRRLAEAKRRRLSATRKRRLAEANRRRKETVYYY